MTSSRYGWNNTGSLVALWPTHIACSKHLRWRVIQPSVKPRPDRKCTRSSCFCVHSNSKQVREKPVANWAVAGMWHLKNQAARRLLILLHSIVAEVLPTNLWQSGSNWKILLILGCVLLWALSYTLVFIHCLQLVAGGQYMHWKTICTRKWPHCGCLRQRLQKGGSIVRHWLARSLDLGSQKATQQWRI